VPDKAAAATENLVLSHANSPRRVSESAFVRALRLESSPVLVTSFEQKPQHIRRQKLAELSRLRLECDNR
jgi:hypothetical protein